MSFQVPACSSKGSHDAARYLCHEHVVAVELFGAKQSKIYVFGNKKQEGNKIYKFGKDEIKLVFEYTYLANGLLFETNGDLKKYQC